MNGVTKFSIKRLHDKGLSDEEIAHILGCDLGRIRIISEGKNDPEWIVKQDNLISKPKGSRSPSFGKWRND